MERLEQINLYLAFYKHLLGSRFLNAEAKDCTEKVYEHRHSYIWFKKMSISVCDGQSPLYIRQRIKIKLLIVDHNKKWSNGGGGKETHFLGSLTWQKVSRVKLPSSNIKQMEGPILPYTALLPHLPLADSSAKTLPALGSANPLLTSALLST